MNHIDKALKKIYNDFGKVLFLVVTTISILGCLYFLSTHIFSQKLRVSFFDVGQGDAIFVQTPSGKSVLIDGGATDVILERLSKEKKYFDKNIDVMIVTHPDSDHVTGLIPVLEKYSVGKILQSKEENETEIFKDLKKHIIAEGSEMYTPHTGDSIDFHDGVIIKILYPNDRPQYKKVDDTNLSSLSLIVEYKGYTFLLTGDLPISGEHILIENGMLPKNITAYKAGHHGSKTSSGEELLSYIKPEYAVISAGKNNKYGHPSADTLERLKMYSKEIVSTIEKGSISFVTDGKTLEVETSKR